MTNGTPRDIHYADRTRGYEINASPIEPEAEWPVWAWAVTDLRTGHVVRTGETKGSRATALQHALNAMNQHELEKDLSRGK